MFQTFGRLPDRSRNAWNKPTDFFNDDGKSKQEWSDSILNFPNAVEYPMDKVMADIGSEDGDQEPRKGEVILEPGGTGVPHEGVAQLKNLLNGIFKWVPEERISLDDVLNNS
jgi:serine/threonine-protein kinase SRPK3